MGDLVLRLAYLRTRSRSDGEADTLAEAESVISRLRDTLEMVRDADDDCRKDGLPTIPPIPRAKIDAALAREDYLRAKGEGDG